MSERDTHFQGFAKLLWQDIEEECRKQSIYLDSGYSSEELLELMQPLIARAAYDLVNHIAIEQCKHLDTWARDAGGEWDVDSTPDLIQWPNRSTE